VTDPDPQPTDAFTELEDCLAFWHPSLDEEVSDDYLDWGAVARASSADRVVRVRNMSTDYTAVGVTVAVQAPPDDTAVPGTAVQHLLSADGDTFAATAELGDLDPLQTSGPLALRRVTAPDANAGPGRFVLVAGPAAWSPAALQGAGTVTITGQLYDGLPYTEEQ
jgi:hypothetical protein